jgi:hypothetical protein
MTHTGHDAARSKNVTFMRHSVRPPELLICELIVFGALLLLEIETIAALPAATDGRSERQSEV